MPAIPGMGEPMSVRCRSPVSVSTAFSVIVTLGAGVGVAQAQTRNFDIPQEPVDKAIADFASQSGLQIVAPTRRLRAVVTQPLNGSFDSREALRRLLIRTGLEVSSDNGSVIVLRLATHGSDPVAPAKRAGAPGVLHDRNSISQRIIALDEVVITAEKRTGSALTTPVSLTVYGAEALQENQVNSLADLPNIDPSINVTKGILGDVITLHGVTSADFTSKGTPDIAFNVDGVPVTRGFELAEPLFDLERVELLKGPQGTLYGASSTAGALNVITAKPGDQFGASADVTAGNYDTRRATGVINVPLTDGIAVRAAVNYNDHDGYSVLPNGAAYTDGEHNFTARLSELIKFTSDMDLLLRETFGNVDGPSPGGVNYDTLLNEPKGAAQRVVYYNPYSQRVSDTYRNFTAQFNWVMGRVHLDYVAGHLSYSADEATSSTNNPYANDRPLFSTPMYVHHEYVGQFLTDSHEVRLSNQKPGAVDWLIGGNWFRENIHEDDHYWSAAQLSTGNYPTEVDLVNRSNVHNATLHTNTSIFGQTTWHTTSRLDLTAGLRETWDELARRGTFANGPVTGCVAPQPCNGSPNNGSENDSKLTYRATAAYHFAPERMLYATVASGFKGGGFNDFCGDGPCPYKPEELVSYELGYKDRLRANFELNSSLFYYDYTSMQIPKLSMVGNSNVLFTGVYSAMIEGWENELIFRPTSVDSLHLNLVNLRSRYGGLATYLPSSSGPSGPSINLDGLSMGATPATAATLSYAHDVSMSSGAALRFHAQVKYSSGYSEVQIAPYYRYTQAPFTRSNLSLRYTSAGDRFYVGAYVLNIENKLQITSPPANGGTVYPGQLPGANAVNVSDPRTWGFTAGIRL